MVVKPAFRPQWHQIHAICTVSVNAIISGQLISWPSPSIPILLEQGVSLDDASYLTIAPALTAIVASLFVGRLIDIIGRRSTLLGIAIPYSLSWILIAIAGSLSVDSAPWPLVIFYASRIVEGIGDACFYSSGPCYVTEIATPSVRGTWGNTIALMLIFGIFIMNAIGAYLSITNTAIVSLILPIIFFINYFFLVESPYYLLMKGNVDGARASLQWLRGTTNVEEELQKLTNDVQRQQSETGRFIDLIKIPSNRRACIAGILIRAAQQYSGISAFSVYAQLIFLSSGSDLSASMSAIVFSGCLFICAFVASFFLDYLGRRKAMLISSMGTSLILVIQTAFFYIQSETDISTENLKAFPLVSMLLFVAFFAIGLCLVPTLMIGELFSSSVKSKAYIVMNIFFGFSVASSAKIFAACFSAAGLYAGFLFLAICSILSVFISYFVVPETRGKTLEEIQQSFKK